MRCVTLQAFPPHRYNLQAPTAHPFQFMRHLPGGLELSLYYFSGLPEHKESSEACIRTLQLTGCEEIPKPSGLSKYYHIAGARMKGLPGSVGMYPSMRRVCRKINEERPDLIWMYPHWLLDWKPWLECHNIVVSGPDSAVLHNERALKYGSLDDAGKKRQEALLKRNLRLERAWGEAPVRMHMVGQEDLNRYVALNQGRAKAFFIRHPLYDYIPARESLAEARGRLRVIVSGGGSTVFVGDHLNRIVIELAARSGQLASRLQFLFIGKGYEKDALVLKESGYSVETAAWVDNYEEALSTGHVHLFPIAVGTGTKGKVLTALAAGLLCVGSAFAFENIAVEDRKECLFYEDPVQAVNILADVARRPADHAAIAARGALRVQNEHDPEKTAEAFWAAAMKN